MRCLLVATSFLVACAGNANVDMPGRGRLEATQTAADAGADPSAPSPPIDASQSVPDADIDAPSSRDGGPKFLNFTYPSDGRTWVQFTPPSDYPVDSLDIRVVREGRRKEISGACASTSSTETSTRDDPHLFLANSAPGYCQPNVACALSFEGWCSDTVATLSY